MMLSSEFTPDTHPSPHAVQDADKAALCRVRIGDVHDLRDDTLTMGAFGEFTLRAIDTASWVRAGLQSLNRDQRLLVDDGTQDSSALVLNADLLKAYVMDSARD
jgi:hypothetical protein